jgi:hypothetical protein
MANKGINNTKDIHIKSPDLMRFKRSFTESVIKAREDQFSNAGIDTFHGHALMQLLLVTEKVTEYSKVEFLSSMAQYPMTRSEGFIPIDWTSGIEEQQYLVRKKVMEFVPESKSKRLLSKEPITK